jgi:N-acetylglucosamine-6-sulfatase
MRLPMLASMLLLGALSAGLQSVPGASTAAAVLPSPKPNFVVIFLDDMRADQQSALPYTRAAIGGQGATFDNAYAPYPLCCPARATILSGQYPHNNHVFGNVPPYGGVAAFDDSNTIATWMKGAGYKTAYIGKYFNGYGEATSSTYRPPGWTEWDVLARGLYNYRSFTMNINRRLVDYVGSYQTHAMGDLSTRFIRRNAASPFLMVTGFKAPHSGGPREPDDPAVTCFDTDLCGNKTPAVAAEYRDSESGHRIPASPAYDEADVSDKPAHIASLPPFQPEFRAAHQELWEQQLESIHSVDDQIQRIVWTLRQAGVLQRTYILVTSDNGYLLGEHRIPFGKVHPYEPSARIPMMLRGPGIPAGVHAKQLVGLQDIAPTVLRASGNYGAQTLVLDGVSLLRLTTDPTAAAGRDLALEAGPAGDGTDDGAVRDASPAARAYRGIRTDSGWKYIRYGGGEQELYNLETDPDEMNNLAGDPEHAAQLATLAEGAARLSGCVGRACTVSAAP